jgi:hypothetical protein
MTPEERNDSSHYSRLRRWLIVTVLIAVLVGLAWGGWGIYRCISVSIEAEYNLHATIMTVRVVTQFVTENKRWPNSWNELDRQLLPENPQWGMYQWPESSSDIQRRVSIDFNPNLRAMASQDQSTFTAIQPIGPFYEYRHYGFVADLQFVVRQSIDP